MVTEVELVEEKLVTVKVAVVEPADTVTLGGTVARAVFELVKTTAAPPLGAALVSMTVPCEVFPPRTLAGLSASDETLAPWFSLETFASADRCGDYWSASRRD